MCRSDDQGKASHRNRNGANRVVRPGRYPTLKKTACRHTALQKGGAHFFLLPDVGGLPVGVGGLPEDAGGAPVDVDELSVDFQ